MVSGKKFAVAAPIVWAAIVFLLHVIKLPVKKDPEIHIPHFDKFIHFCLFTGLTFLIARSVKFLHSELNWRKSILIVIISFGYGGLLEIIQGLSWAARDSDVFDWIADIAGSISGVILATSGLLPFFFKHDVGKTP